MAVNLPLGRVLATGWDRCRADPRAPFGFLVLGAWVVAALLAPVIVVGDPNQQELADALLPPAWVEGGTPTYLFGTDQLGRDILVRVIYGAQSSLFIGIIAVLGSAFIGSAVGVCAAQWGGLIDDTLMRLADIQLSIPFFLLAVAALAMLGGSAENMIAILIVSGWVSYARVIRSELIYIRETEFLLAAKSVGAGPLRIALKYLLPSTYSLIVVTATLQLADVILLSAGLSFLGVGLQPPAVSWGTMLADGRDYLTTAWWISTIPGIAITVAITSVNLVGDWLSDKLNPRLYGER